MTIPISMQHFVDKKKLKWNEKKIHHEKERYSCSWITVSYAPMSKFNFHAALWNSVPIEMECSTLVVTYSLLLLFLSYWNRAAYTADVIEKENEIENDTHTKHQSDKDNKYIFTWKMIHLIQDSDRKQCLNYILHRPTLNFDSENIRCTSTVVVVV